MNRNENEIRFDLLDILKHLRKKVWIILAVTVAFAVLGLIYSLVFITPEYTSSTRIYVLSRRSEDAVVSSDFQVSNYMLNDYKELIKGRNVTGEVIKQLGLNMGAGELSGKISVYSPQNTRILQISVTDTDPARAQQIANAVREVASVQLKNIMQVDSVTTIYTAGISKVPSSPNVSRNTLRAGIIGLFLALAIYVVIYFVDDRIRTEEDVERYLGLSIMGVIPDTTMPFEATAAQRRPSARRRGNRTWK